MRTALYIVGLSLAVPGAVAAQELSKGDFLALAERCAPKVDGYTLLAIATVESSLRTFVVNDNSSGKSSSFSTVEDAARAVDDLLLQKHSVDAGVMQINSANFAHLGLDSRTVFDPCQAIRAASVLLGSRYKGGETAEERQWSLRGAISAYNTGSLRRGFDNGYVYKVEAAAGVSMLSAATIRSLRDLRVASPLVSEVSVPGLAPTVGIPPAINAVSAGNAVVPEAQERARGIELETWDVWKSFARRQAEKHAVAGDEDRAPYRQNDHILFE